MLIKLGKLLGKLRGKLLEKQHVPYIPFPKELTLVVDRNL